MKYYCPNVKKISKCDKKKRAIKESTYDDNDDNTSSSSDDDDSKLEKLVNLCMIANIDITK
jgi:hypothetical protein